MFRYEIDDKNTVTIYSDEFTYPVVSQPWDPETGETFTKAKAKAWAETEVALRNAPQVDPAPNA